MFSSTSFSSTSFSATSFKGLQAQAVGRTDTKRWDSPGGHKPKPRNVPKPKAKVLKFPKSEAETGDEEIVMAIVMAIKIIEELD